MSLPVCTSRVRYLVLYSVIRLRSFLTTPVTLTQQCHCVTSGFYDLKNSGRAYDIYCYGNYNETEHILIRQAL